LFAAEKALVKLPHILAVPPLLAGCSGEPDPFEAALNARRQYDPAQLARGAKLYQKHCARCHGDRGQSTVLPWNVRQADGFYPPPPLDDTAHAWHHPSAVLAGVVGDGSPPGEGRMPAWRGILATQDIADVVVYLTSFWSDATYRLWFEQIETPARRAAAAP
jgi:mono/diheme cytochrome c family protein